MTDDERILTLLSYLLTLRLTAALHPGQVNRAIKATCQRLRDRTPDRLLNAELRAIQNAPVPAFKLDTLWHAIETAAGGTIHYE